MNHLEIEFKTMLTKAEYLNLLPTFQNVPAIKQTNYYLDTPNMDARNIKLSFRIRTFEDGAELTLKVPTKTIGHMEYNLDLSLEQAHDIINGGSIPDSEIKELLLSHSINPESIHSLGSLTTIRRELKTDIGLLALDESYYFGKKDYEIEIEVTDAKKGKEDFYHFLEENKIEYKKARGKIARFVKCLQNS